MSSDKRRVEKVEARRHRVMGRENDERDVRKTRKRDTGEKGNG